MVFPVVLDFCNPSLSWMEDTRGNLCSKTKYFHQGHFTEEKEQDLLFLSPLKDAKRIAEDLREI